MQLAPFLNSNLKRREREPFQTKMLQNNGIAWEIISSFRRKKSFYYLVGKAIVCVLYVISHRLGSHWLPFPIFLPYPGSTPSTPMSHVFLKTFSPLSGVTFQCPHLQSLLICSLGDWIVSLKVFSSSIHFS